MAKLGPCKNEPDKPGKQQKYPTYIQPGRRLANTGLIYDSKERKFILAKKDEIKKEKNKHPDVSDVYKSEVFHTMTSKPDKDDDCSDVTCSLDNDEAAQACMQLCIDG